MSINALSRRAPAHAVVARPLSLVQRAARLLALSVALLVGVLSPSLASAHGCTWEGNPPTSDLTAPVVEPGPIDPYWTFNSRFLPHTVSATFTLTDDLVGPQLPTVIATSDHAPAGVDERLRRIQATVKEVSPQYLPATAPHTYVATVDIPEGAIGGTWTFTVLEARDGCGNVTTDIVGPGKFFVIGLGADFEAPVLQSSSLNTSANPCGCTIDLAGGAATVSVTLHVTDNYAGTRDPVVDLVAPDGTVYRSATATLVSGHRADGQWKASLSIAADAPCGIWTVRLRGLTDQLGNTRPDQTIATLTVSNSNADGANGGGSNGKDGANGVDGTNGTNGVNGINGVNGTNGTNANTPQSALVPGPKSYLTFVSSKKKLKVTAKGSMSFKVKCNGLTRCKGSIRLYAKVKGKKIKIVAKRVAVAPGKTVKVIFKLTKNGKKTVKRRKTVKKVSLSIWSDGIKAPRTVTLAKVVRS